MCVYNVTENQITIIMKSIMKTVLTGAAAVAVISGCGSGNTDGAYSTPAIPKDPKIEANVEKTLKGSGNSHLFTKLYRDRVEKFLPN